MTRALVIAVGLVCLAGNAPASAEEYQLQVVARGLLRPMGIAVAGSETLYFTQVPQPGVGGEANGVFSLNIESGEVTTLHQGEPEPTNVALDSNENVYWTCKSAGVILTRFEGETVVLLSGLNHPVGIALDHKGRGLFFTEVPTPGVPGSRGGLNSVKRLDLQSMQVTSINEGDPEPTDVAVARNGRVYWTCTSAGVIVEARLRR